MISPVRLHLNPAMARIPATRSRLCASRTHAARLALVWGVGLFLVLNFALVIALETVRPEWRDPEFGHRLRLLQADAQRPLILAIGTSRTQNAIAPAAMGFPPGRGAPRVFNFGQSAATPLKELLTLRRVRDAGIKPAAVLVELFPPGLAVNSPAEDDFRDRAARLSLKDLRHLAPHTTNPATLRKTWFAARAVPWYTQRQVLMSHARPRWLPWSMRIDFQWDSLDADGFQPVPGLPPERTAALTALARREYSGAFAGFQPGKVSERAVRELVAVCRHDAIPVAFFIPPISPVFRAAFAPGVLAASDAYLHNLGRELGVAVFPARDDLQESDFMDGHHLLQHGAEAYSRWLAETHVKPWFSRLDPTLAQHSVRVQE